MAQTLADIAPDDIVWDDSATAQPPTNNDWLTSAPRVALYDVDPADIDWWEMGRWRDRTLMESAQKTIGEAGNAVKRGLAMSRLASEMEQPAPDPAKIIEIQREIAQSPPSAEFQTVMNDNATPQESWSAFTRNPVGVVNELMLDSLSSYASQMFEKAPARVAVGAGAGAAIGAPVLGYGAIPAGATGALAGFAQSGGASSYSLEMAGGILESLEQAGVNMGSPEELGAALQDEQRMQVAREFAQKKAIPVAAFDTVSALIAGRVMGAKPATVLQKLGRGMVETAIQSVLGMSGEATGQLSQSGEITSVRQIGAEGVGEIYPGMIEVGVGTGVQAMQGQQPAAAAPAAAAPQPAPFTPPPAAETVVVEEVFGDPTTAAAEPVAATPEFDASQPFEVAQEPSETIVTEPPAAPRFQFDLADDTATAPEMDAAADVFAGVPQQQTPVVAQEPQAAARPEAMTLKELYAAKDAAEVAREDFFRVKVEANKNAVSEAAKRLKRTKDGSPGNVKARAELQRLKAESDSIADERNDATWRQADPYFQEYERRLKLQAGTKSEYSISASRPGGPMSATADTLTSPGILSQNAPVKTPAAATEKVATEMAASTVDPSRPVPASVRDGVIAQLQAALAEVQESGDKGRQRVSVSIPGDGNFQIIKTEESIKKAITGLSKLSAPVSTALPRVTLTESVREIDNYAGVLEETLGIEGAIEDQQALLKQAGENTSIGKAAAKTIEALQRRAEVRAGNAPAQRSRARIKNMTAQSGAIDLSIVEDLVEYGKTVYRAGMDYATWAAAMTREFGQQVAAYLRDAFDRIVASYRNSVFADETGAVGGRRPVRFKRSISQLEALAKDSEAFKTWFEDFRKYLETDFLSQFPEYAPLVNEFLSATSAATSVSANVPIMVRQLKHFLETGEIKTTFLAHANNLQRAISGQKLEGPKISEYSDAVFGNPDAIPVDRHIAQIMFGVKAPSSRQIAAAKTRIREIAVRLNWEPRQVMAALWAANQKLNNQPSESYERHLERFKGELLSILSQDRSGEGRGLQASRRIADRISAAGRSEGSSGDGARAAKARVSAKITSQSGAIDLSIVEDLVQYGQTIYRAGMSFGKWAGQMVKEFGQGIASFLRQAFDRIVQAYKDSPYSDTTGAVGDVRPKAKPRQFEQKAAKAPGISEEARAQMGNDPYVPITLRGVAEQAKAWIGENGIEAAERRILGLADEGQTPTPLDFAIGLELTANLSATGNAARAAAVVRTMSRRATSLGQTISTLAMLSRLTPEGIVFYANQIIEQHISSLPPERQAEIRAAQDDVANLEETVATTRKRTAEDAIINGEQGGEKIQEKLKRRIPDKAKKQDTNVSIRSVLTSQATKAEATKQITQILTESGISQSEATALATAITNRFYKVLEDARKALATSRKPAKGKGRVTIDKLLAQLKDGKITDEEFVSALAQVRGVPALTAADKARIQNLATQYKASTDDQISLVLAARLFEEVHSIIPPDFWVKLRALSYLSMLFAPKTWIRNLGGNQIQWIANAGRDAVINMVVDPTMSLLTGRRTSAFGNTKRLRSLLTPIEDVIRGYKWNQQQNPSASVMENMRAGIEHLRVLAKMTTQNKFEITDAKEVGRRIFSSKFMASWETALSIALGGGDRGFWMSAFTASLGQREAAAKKNGEWTGQPTPEDIEAAYADAMHAIYQNPNVISQSANRIRAALNRISTFGRTDQFGLGTALLAFTQVPGSITMRGLIEWSPLGMINALYEGMRPLLYKATNGKGGGNFRQEQFNKAFTQALLGSGGLFVGGYWLYALGVVTASREEDDDLEAMRRASGLGGYRINLSALKRLFSTYTKQEPEDGDLIVSYDWAQPLAITFAAGAELAKQVEENDREGIKKGLAGKAGMAAISLAAGAKSLEEQPLLSGLSSFMKTWGYSGPLDAIVNTISGVPSMFVPQLVRQANQLMDNTVRETRGDEGMKRAFSRIAANTPGVADVFPPRMDIMGQAIERYQYAGNTVFNVLINPTMTSRVKSNPALQEVSRLMQTTGEASQVPRQVGRSVAINGESVNLSNEQISAYQYYLGNYTMSTFNWRMASPRYARLPDTEKVRLLSQDLEDMNAAVKSALFGHDVNRLTRRQRVMRNNLVNSPLGQSMPPR